MNLTFSFVFLVSPPKPPSISLMSGPGQSMAAFHSSSLLNTYHVQQSPRSLSFVAEKVLHVHACLFLPKGTCWCGHLPRMTAGSPKHSLLSGFSSYSKPSSVSHCIISLIIAVCHPSEAFNGSKCLSR